MELERAIERVVRSGNCTGCGGCEWLFAGVSMELDTTGQLRPTVASSRPAVPDEVRRFLRICPGVAVREVEIQDKTVDPVFGPYMSAWRAWATDEELRRLGSSGGVLSALTAWLAAKQPEAKIVASAADPSRPSRTIPLVITGREDACQAAGSRYAPVANLPRLGEGTSRDVLVGKPCEVAAAQQRFAADGISDAERPLLLSFFCAGTPSQNATDALASQLGIEADDVTQLRYRGDGWPGRFVVQGRDGTRAELSYHESWGGHLGRDLPWRCKLCAHGTGDHADLVVGDYWKTDDRGYPVFDDAEGESIVLLRTQRGCSLFLEAVEAGILTAFETTLTGLRSVQPLQVERRMTLAGRMLGRRMAGHRVPRYVGFRLLSSAVRMPIKALRAAVGTWRRSVRERRVRLSRTGGSARRTQ